MLFKVILEKPESTGDFWYGYWLKPIKEVNEVFVFRQEYFKAFDLLKDEPSGICPVSGSLDSCLACFNGEHKPDEYIKMSAFEVRELLEMHPYRVKAKTTSPFLSNGKNYMSMPEFYTEIDATIFKEKEDVCNTALNICRLHAVNFWRDVNYSVDDK